MKYNTLLKALFVKILLLFSSISVSSAQGLPNSHCINRTFKIIAHVVLNESQAPGMSQQDLQDALDITNKDFEGLCVKFEICEYNIIKNYQFDIFNDSRLNDDGFTQEDELNTLFQKKDYINVYFMSALVNPDALCGYTKYERDMVFIQKFCLFNERSLSHNLAHLFGLRNLDGTFKGGTPNSSIELIDGSNSCDPDAGDGVCDTPADPGNVPTTSRCEYLGTSQQGNQYYQPNVGNIMSKGDPNCKCHKSFTEGQLNKMADVIRTDKKHLW